MGKEMLMPPKDSEKVNQIIAEARRRRQQQEKGYREKALKLFPAICARCGREFEGKKLRELTVHHKDHNHDNNPPDGSNWELLCIYCHDNEHNRQAVADAYEQGPSSRKGDPSFDNKPFAGLEKLLKKNDPS
jgi:5-methylcytosine-specific restriction endonuclease McrA